MTFSYLVDVKRWINKTRKHSSPRAIHNIDQNIHNYKICRWWIGYVSNSYLWIQVCDWLTTCHGVVDCTLAICCECQLTRVKRCRSKTPSFQPGRPTCHGVVLAMTEEASIRAFFCHLWDIIHSHSAPATVTLDDAACDATSPGIQRSVNLHRGR